MRQAGKPSFVEETVPWDVTNQFTKKSDRVELPKMLVGDTWLGRNADVTAPSPIVDEVKSLVGGTCTIFQRMNPAGDMLRVCTNVEKTDGTRAIGTYIPATDPDGTPNAVVSALLRGETYVGRAKVVNDWCATAYEPLLDAEGKVVGALLWGQAGEHSRTPPRHHGHCGRQDRIRLRGGRLRRAEGPVYHLRPGQARRREHLGGQGRRRQPVHPVGRHEGVGNQEWRVRLRTVSLEERGESEARRKIAAVTYFEPWDWVIGVGAYEADYQDARRESTPHWIG